MKVKDAIKQLQEYSEDSNIFLMYWDAELLQEITGLPDTKINRLISLLEHYMECSNIADDIINISRDVE